LIVTGENGSGKTTLLQELNSYLARVANQDAKNRDRVRNSVDELTSRIAALEWVKNHIQQ
jgi:ABC-type molybdenum transport system ATPase subunit/photorepair protein PhrA